MEPVTPHNPHGRQQFRVVIVGGGPVGLTAAHALSKAGIDWVVLEARDTVTPEDGASIIVYASTLRVWDQLGLFETFIARGEPLETNTNVTPAGKLYHNGTPGANFEMLHGIAPIIFHRQELMEILYTTLPAHARDHRVLTGKRVTELLPDTSGISVMCADGTVERGSIVLGVDGVHSQTRGMMRELALSSPAPPLGGRSQINPERPYVATYRCLWGTCPPPAECLPRANNDCHGPLRSIMFLTTQKRSWFFLYEQLEDEPRQGRYDYTLAEKEAMATRFTDMHIVPDLTFGQVWPTRWADGISDLYEGVLPTWSFCGRVVLAGDAVHKATPNIGWGYNMGIADVAVLVSLLRKTVQTAPFSIPSSEALAAVFSDYQSARMADIEEGGVISISGMATRQSARPRQLLPNLAYWLVETVGNIVPHFEYIMTKYVLAKIMRRGRVLDFLAGNDDLFKGLIPWHFPMDIHKPGAGNGCVQS
ncbi:flavoprotein monooxygenase [Thozetella sp. PMI_491]|nr:flavoprotein monooxygenase [Thozetella sp. PMI_491]